jgi:integrase
MAKKYNYVKNGVQYYRKTKTIGHDIHGNPIKKEFYGDGEKDTDRQIEEYMNNLKSGLPVGYEKITVGMAMNTWLKDVLFNADDFKSASYEKHETNFRLYIKDSPISILPIYNIVSLPIKQWYNYLYEKGISTNKIKDINKTLSSFFSYEITQNMLTYNPCTNKRIKIPGNSQIDIEKLDKDNEQLFLTDKEIQLIKNNLDFNNRLHVAIWLSLTHMLRQGEVLGLSVKHIDTKAKNIKVRQILSKAKIYNKDGTYKRVLRLATPKSKSSIRTVPMIDKFVPVIKNHISSEKKRFMKNNVDWNEDCLLFLNNNFNYWDPKNFRTGWERFLKRIGLPKYKFHILRHTGASLLFREGASLEEVQEILGHEDSNITKKIYLHFHPDDKRKSINKLNSLF